MANPARFLREVRQEASRVVWPTRKETLISAAMVLALVVIASVFFMLADSLISWVIKKILGMGT